MCAWTHRAFRVETPIFQECIEMAKGQQRSNKEAKKPKKEAAPAAKPGMSMASKPKAK